MARRLKSVKTPVVERSAEDRVVLRAKSGIGQMLRMRRSTDWMRDAVGSVVLKGNGMGMSKFFRRRTDLDRVKSLGDSELIEVVQNQNREAYHELFDRYQKKLFVYIYHMVGNKEETEDLLQNVFIKTYRNIEHFDKERKFSSWIYRIAHNETVNFIKRKHKKRFISFEDVVSSKDKLDSSTLNSVEQPEEIWLHKEITQEVRAAMEKLPPKYKQVLELRYFTDYSYDHIGKVLGKPVNTVGTLINRAKKKLLSVVKEQGKR